MGIPDHKYAELHYLYLLQVMVIDYVNTHGYIYNAYKTWYSRNQGQVLVHV